jgi:D-arabinose 1-dehydrogenase-like Zn-dependent alcohol dehydrogenase
MVVNAADELDAAIHREWPDGVDACIDTVGFAASGLGCVRDGGRFVTSVPTAVPEPTRDIAPQTVQVLPDADGAAELARQAAAGELTVRVAEVLPLERFRDAYTRLSRGGLKGKIVLTPSADQN